MATPDVRVRLSAEGQKEVVDAFRKIQAEADKAGKTQQKGFGTFNKALGNTVKLLGAVGVGVSTIGALRGFQKGLAVLREWETRFAEIKTISSETEANLAVLEKRLLGLGSIIPQDSSLLAKGFYQVLSSGITDSGDALYFLRRAGKAATAGLTEIEKAVDVGTSILNAYKLEIADTDRIFDSLFTTVREGKVTFDQLSSALGPAIPIFQAAGFQFEELLAGVATLTKGGFPVEQAVTALRDVVVKLIKPTDQAKAAAQELGIEFSTEAAAAKGLVGFLAEVAEKTEGNEEAIGKLFPDVRGLAAVLGLAGAQLDEFGNVLDSVKNDTGSAQDAFDKMSKTQEAQEQILRNRLKNAWIEFGKTIQDVTKSSISVAGALLPRSFEEQEETLQRLSRQIDRVETRGKKLADRYVELRDNSDGSAESQQKVVQAMRDLADEFPEVIAGMNELGEVTAVNVDRLGQFGREMERLRALAARDTFGQQAKRADELQKTIADLSAVYGELEGKTRAETIQFERKRLGSAVASGVEQTIAEERIRIRGLVLAAEAELADVNAKLASTLISAELAAEIIAFDELRKSVNEGVEPESALSQALANVSEEMQVLFQTADPEKLQARITEMAKVLRKVDPELRFFMSPFDPSTLGGGGGGGGGVPAGTIAGAEKLAAVYEEAQERQRQELADFLNQSFGTEFTAGMVKSLQESEPQLFAFFSRIMGDALKAQAAVQERILQAEGNLDELSRLRINREIAQLDERLRQAGVSDLERAVQLTQLRAQLEKVADFEEIRRDAKAAIDDVALARQAIDAKVSRGLITQEEGEKQILELERERLEVLTKLAEAYLAAAEATNDPEKIRAAQEFQNALIGMGEAGGMTEQKLSGLGEFLEGPALSGVNAWFDAMLSGTKNVREAFEAMGLAIIEQIAQILTQMLAARIAMAGLSLFGGGGQVGGGGGGKAGGGRIHGPGTSTSDSIPIWASVDEYIVRAHAVRQPGVLRHLEAINRVGAQALRSPNLISPLRFAGGGLVGSPESATSSTEAGRPDSLVVGLEEGLVLRAWDSPKGRRLFVKLLSQTRRASSAALGT